MKTTLIFVMLLITYCAKSNNLHIKNCEPNGVLHLTVGNNSTRFGSHYIVMESKRYYNYLVYENGQIYSLKRKRFMSQYPDERGYLRAGIRISGKTKNATVHRIVATSFIPNPENKPQVNHKDGVKTNNNVGNLEWATCAENVRHAWANGLGNTKPGNEANAKKVINTASGEIYNSQSEAALKTGINVNTLRGYMQRGHKNKTTLKFL